MPSVESEFAFLQIPRLAADATSARPVWLWSADASHLLWANAVGAAVFGITGAAEHANIRFAPTNPLPAQIARLAAALPSSGAERLERLRGVGGGLGRPVVCACSRIVLPDGAPAILVAACEPAGPALPFGERLRRLFSGLTGALAVFDAGGELLYSTGAALPRLGGVTTLSALGLDDLGAEALRAGRASGSARGGEPAAPFTVLRLGRDDSRALLLTLPPGDAALARVPAETEQPTTPATSDAPKATALAAEAPLLSTNPSPTVLDAPLRLNPCGNTARRAAGLRRCACC